MSHALSVFLESTDQDIKDRFKQLALKWHPDKNPEDPKAAEEVQECVRLVL